MSRTHGHKTVTYTYSPDETPPQRRAAMKTWKKSNWAKMVAKTTQRTRRHKAKALLHKGVEDFPSGEVTPRPYLN